MSGLVPYAAGALAHPDRAAMAVDLITEGVKAYRGRSVSRSRSRNRTPRKHKFSELGRKSGASSAKRNNKSPLLLKSLIKSCLPKLLSKSKRTLQVLKSSLSASVILFTTMVSKSASLVKTSVKKQSSLTGRLLYPKY